MKQHEYPLKVALGIEFRQNHQLLYIGVARNNQGYQELNRYLSHHNQRALPLLSKAPLFENVFIIYPWGQAPEDLRGHEFIGVRSRDLNKVITSHHARNHNHLVVWHPVTFKDKSTYNVHRLLRAIDLNTILSKLSSEQQASTEEVMVPISQLKKTVSAVSSNNCQY